ncbi:mu-like prophage Flumu F protein [Candidatus Magnetoovum chiemensis]|nr:mu-like prophage Flumu F protein [Candidatus Magnetoovum chiemensis]
MEAQYKDLPFDEAIEYFRQKINLPTATWKDLWQEMHTRAFVIAGAMKSELLSDFRAEIAKALSEGTSIQEFRKNFDNIVSKHGWTYKGSRKWRTGVIFNTNLTVAYQAGRYKQMTTETALKAFPYWRYRTMDDRRVRPEHASWNDVTLKADDPWWSSHYPPNGWGCRCQVENITQKEMERLKAGGRIRTTAPQDGTYQWKDEDTGEVREIPVGIDAGWAYNPGEATWGKRIAEATLNAVKAQGRAGWAELIEDTYEDLGRPALIPLDKTNNLPTPNAKDIAELRGIIEQVIGGVEALYEFTEGDFTYSVLVNAEAIANHIKLDRSKFMAYLAEVLSEPFEIWLQFMKSKATGKVILRERLIKGFDLGKGQAIMIVFESTNGVMTAITIFPTKDWNYLNRQRKGKLIWKK